MATVGEARLLITAADDTGRAFASVEDKVKALARNVGEVSKEVANVSRIAASVAPISGRVGAVAAEINRVTVATRALAAEEARLNTAREKLAGFKALQPSFVASRQEFNQARANVEALAKQLAATAEPTAKMKREFVLAQNAVSAASTAFESQKTALLGAKAEFEALDGPLTSVRSAEERLAGAIERTNAAMAEQGRVAARSSEQLAAAVRKEETSAHRHAALLHQFTNEVLPFAGPAILEGVKHSVEAAADVEQLRFRVRELSRHDPSEAPFVDQLADDVAKKYPAVSRGKAFDTYLELRPNAASGDPNAPIDQTKARNNLMTAARAQTAALALDFEMTPVDMQNLLKSVEGSGRAGDQKAVEKISDAYIRAKQVFGTAIASSMLRDYVANAKSANFSIGDDQFYLSNMVRMSEGNASRLGNEVNQTMTSLAGGAMKAQAGKWLVEHGLARANQLEKMGGGNVRVRGGLKDSATLQTDQATWAATTLRAAIEKSGALSDAKINARMEMLRGQELKRNPNAQIDDRFLRERAEEGLIAADLAKTGLRTTVTDNLAHFIGNQRLIERDVGQLQRASGIDAGDRLGENPVASFKELSDAIGNFSAVLSGPAMQKAGPLLDQIAHGIANLSASVASFYKENPKMGTALSTGGLAAGLGIGGWLSWKLLSGFGSAIMGNGGGAALTGSAVALDGSAAALDVSAAALDRAAAALMGGGIKNAPGGPANIVQNAEKNPAVTGGLLAGLWGDLVAGGLAFGLGLGLNVGDASGNKMVEDYMARRLKEAERLGQSGNEWIPAPQTESAPKNTLALSQALDRAYLDQNGPYGFRADPEGAHGKGYHGGGSPAYQVLEPRSMDVNVTGQVSGMVQSEQRVVVEAGSELLRILQAVQKAVRDIPVAGSLVGESTAGRNPSGAGHR